MISRRVLGSVRNGETSNKGIVLGKSIDKDKNKKDITFNQNQNNSIDHNDHNSNSNSIDGVDNIDRTNKIEQDLKCPICEESMIALSQLNKHLDDLHFSAPESENKQNDLGNLNKILNENDNQKTKKLKHLNGNKNENIPGFNNNNDNSNNNNNINNTEADNNVNIFNKDKIIIKDLSFEFEKSREKYLEEKEIEVIKLRKRIYLLNDNYEQSKSNKNRNKFKQNERNLINWEEDKSVKNCFICNTRFNFLIRKHHCRLCGKIVCDGLGELFDSNDHSNSNIKNKKDKNQSNSNDIEKEKEKEKEGEKENISERCSMVVPISLLVDNKSKYKDNYNEKKEIDKDDSNYKLRVCLNCKEILFLKKNFIKNKMKNENKEFFRNFKMIKNYEKLISNNLILLRNFNGDSADSVDNANVNRVKNKFIKYFRNYEMILQKMSKNQGKDEENKSSNMAQIQKNVRVYCLNYLNTKMNEFKEICDEMENKSKVGNGDINGRKSSKYQELDSKTVEEIKENREKLIIMKEQKYLLEHQLSNIIKQRKFEDMQILRENIKQLDTVIQELCQQLDGEQFI
ncbi:phosphatidylinositol-3-phosphate binding protein ASCRUDRAFT_117732 [Ascoidea rubescens DSM 1968]|uniref:FYVE-type domain-containing protein n=1 Tax=Ascoidea rubescens DSM 1968 TaxID=1344418 RepID=A0A1D2VB73_9ASCO|nr:hypothetical protein ASCRUDRAFT_117732 [Ascoidea rubescens DSM 1968]ODV58918.1 hypothetical protein ASCRUDRAFT_117732 [Ascoidea rubescens DSM 1968]